MAEGVLMPKEGITVESCIIGEWKKNVGDHVNVGDILFTYETDKAEFECESTASGTLLEKFYEDGDEVPCLVNVCAIGNPGEDTCRSRCRSSARRPLRTGRDHAEGGHHGRVLHHRRVEEECR